MGALDQRPTAKVEAPIEVKTRPVGDGLAAAFAALTAEDPWLGFDVDAHERRIIEGQSESHLAIGVEKLRRRHAIAVGLGVPRVVYAETLKRRVETDHTHRTRAPPRFARLKMVFDPVTPWEGRPGFRSQIDAAVIPEAFLRGVETGIEGVMMAGPLAGLRLVGVDAVLTDGAFHADDSTAGAFETAAREAFREALHRGGAVLLEPIMRAEVIVPGQDADAAQADFRERRGEVVRVDVRRTCVIVEALAPLANLLGFADQFRASTRGHGILKSLVFAHYAPTPAQPDPPAFRPGVAMRAGVSE